MRDSLMRLQITVAAFLAAFDAACSGSNFRRIQLSTVQVGNVIFYLILCRAKYNVCSVDHNAQRGGKRYAVRCISFML